jgi:hypothetical protein
MSDRNRLVVANGDWAESLPPWLLNEIRDDRWVLLLRSSKRELPAHEKVGDAEALAYLMTLSHISAFPPVLTNIFEYLTREVLARRSPGMPSVSGRMQRKKLTEYEQEELERLKSEIYQRRKEISHPLLDGLKAATRALKKGDG